MQRFQAGLRARGIFWRSSIEVTSLELVQHFVLKGYGVGVSVARPDIREPHGLRALRLLDFPPVELALIYRDRGRDPLFDAFVAATKERVHGLTR